MAGIREARMQVTELNKQLIEAESRSSEVQSKLTSVVSLSRQACGDEDMRELLGLVQDLIRYTQMLLALLTALQAARAAAGDPTALLGLAIAGTSFGLSVVAEIQRPRY